jgi:TfoX/Sxy family transcriptional regulator of competence genes
MGTQKETMEYIVESLGHAKRFSARAMFGEYALYADGKVVALVCDDLLYVKILPASTALEGVCEKDAPYPGAKLHYVVSEDQLMSIEDLPEILLSLAEAIPAPKKKKKKKVAKKPK